MQNNWFECKVRYEKNLETGVNKKVTESYLVDALTFTDAEARIIDEMTPYITGAFEVTHIARDPVSEIMLDPQGDKWYKARVAFLTLDEKSGAEKKTFANIFVQAPDFECSVKNLKDGMSGTISDWEIYSIKESSVLDVFGIEKKG